MSLLHIAWRNLQHRWFASLLTLLSMALGIMLVVVVLTVTGLISESAERSKSIGYNLIVGPKGGGLQMTLNTVFLVNEPVGTVPYSYYMEYLSGSKRQQDYARLGGELEDPDRPGRYGLFMSGGVAIPLCMGDFVDRFRVIGTTTDYFNVLQHGEANDKDYTFSAGRNFEYDTVENGFFEAVVGATVADELDFQLGDQLAPSHGPEGESHAQQFTIVGILEPTATAVDRGVFINIEGFYRLDGHEAPERDAETGLQIDDEPSEADSQSNAIDQSNAVDDATTKSLDTTAEDTTGQPTRPQGKQGMQPLEIDKREVSAVLVRVGNPIFAATLPRQINKSNQAMAVSPLNEITTALETFFSPLQKALLVLTLMVCGVSAISILVSIYNSMNERTHDIAVLRALGASRMRVLLVILSESVLIVVGGAGLGWLLGHAVAAWASQAYEVEKLTGVDIGLFSFNARQELWILPGMILVGIAAGLLPAIMAYRADVSKSLGK
jgi:putative ABC transport system permease protein